jgi:hypothetical protein
MGLTLLAPIERIDVTAGAAAGKDVCVADADECDELTAIGTTTTDTFRRDRRCKYPACVVCIAC